MHIDQIIFDVYCKEPVAGLYCIDKENYLIVYNELFNTKLKKEEVDGI